MQIIYHRQISANFRNISGINLEILVISHSNLIISQAFLRPEMEYCANTASMLAEEIWQIPEGFVEVL